MSSTVTAAFSRMRALISSSMVRERVVVDRPLMAKSKRSVGIDQRARLMDRVAEHVAQRVVEDMSRGMIEHARRRAAGDQFEFDACAAGENRRHRRAGCGRRERSSLCLARVGNFEKRARRSSRSRRGRRLGRRLRDRRASRRRRQRPDRRHLPPAASTSESPLIDSGSRRSATAVPAPRLISGATSFVFARGASALVVVLPSDG